MYTLEVQGLAQEEFESNYYYYKYFVSEKVASDFDLEYRRSLIYIKSNPELYVKEGKKYRKYIFKKFKHVIYYKVVKQKIYIIAILHQSRDMKNIMMVR